MTKKEEKEEEEKEKEKEEESVLPDSRIGAVEPKRRLH